MRIIPDCTVKPLSECNPGQVVRNLSYDTSNFAFVAESKDGGARFLIFLTDEGPQYELISEAYDHPVLVYSGEPVWEIDPNGPFEPPVRNLFNAPGALIRTADELFLNVVAYQGGIRRERGQFALGSGIMGPYRDYHNNVGIFGAWRLSLHDEGTLFSDRTEVAAFSWKAPGTTAE